MQRCLVFRFLKKRAKEGEIEEKRGVSRVCKVREAGGLDQGPLSPPPPITGKSPSSLCSCFFAYFSFRSSFPSVVRVRIISDHTKAPFSFQ